MTFRSPHPDVSIPEVSLTSFVLERAAELGDKPALVDGATGRSVSYRQLARRVQIVRAGLAARGFSKGDVLAIFCPNLPDYAVAFYAIASLGGISTTINPLYTAGELAFQLKDAGAKYVLTIPQGLDRALEASRDSEVREVFVIGGGGKATPFASLLQDAPQVSQVDIDSREDVVALPYSSGTTGFPKGVMLTHYNLVANISQGLQVHSVAESDVVVGVLPFFHIYGMVVTMNFAVRSGATIVTVPRFELETFLQIMQDHGVTRAHLVPPIVLALAKHPIVDQYDLSRLNVILSGAAPLGGDLAEACAERLGCSVIQGYGLTEASPVTHLIPDKPGKNKPGSIGPPIPNTECRVVDTENGDELGSDEAGELWIRGPQVMKGYLDNPDATTQTIDSQGWLHTGDIVHADGDGYFYVVDRLKELIKYKGYQVAPAELEAVLTAHPAVVDAAVIPFPDEEAGEVPMAFVVRMGDATAEDIRAFVAARVAPYKKIRRLEFISEIPKSPSGKILRRILMGGERTERASKP
ncbi:MAG: 4-coumarate--CoA ligase family protein [Actinomycetota bacterium]